MNIKKFTYVLLLVIMVACAPVAINDYFGIMMEPEYAESFEIVSYNDIEGAVYKSNMFMNPNVYAYAEIDKGVVIVKVFNNSDNPIRINYNTDQFFVYNENGEKFLLNIIKEKYSVKEQINRNEAVTFTLELPFQFMESIGTGGFSGINEFSNYSRNTFDLNEKMMDLDEVKKHIKYFAAVFEDQYAIIMKQIPE